MSEYMIGDELVIQESYIGKTKILKDCELILDQMRSLLLKTPTLDINNHPLNRKLGDLLKLQFGFKNAYVTWYRSSISTAIVPIQKSDSNRDGFLSVPIKKDEGEKTEIQVDTSINAWTYSNATVIFKDFRVDAKLDTTNGYYDRAHQHVLAVSISTAMILYADLTGGELLAIILHEIGHNFDKTPYNYLMNFLRLESILLEWLNLGKWASAKKQKGTLSNPDNMNEFIKRLTSATGSLIFGTNIHKEIEQKLSQLLNSILDFIPLARELEQIMVELSQIIDQLNGLLLSQWISLFRWGKNMKELSKTCANPLFLPLHYAMYIPTKKAEKFADSFALTYGYGSELSIAFTKTTFGGIRDLKRVSDNFPILSIITDINYAYHYVANIAIDPGHGSNTERAAFMLATLRKELTYATLDPKLKNELEGEISKIQAIVDGTVKKSVEDRYYISAIFQWVILKVFRGNTFLLERLFPDYTA